MFGIRPSIDRCGVIAGPWQMGKVDQGVFTYWLLGHYFGGELRYIGYGGAGKQVRDVLHVDDLADLIEDQLLRPEHWDGATVNVGGGLGVAACRCSRRRALRRADRQHGSRCSASNETRPGDVRIYLSDCARLGDSRTGARERARGVLEDMLAWVADNERAVQATLA